MTRTLRLLIAGVVVLVLAFVVVGNTHASVEPQIVDVTLTDGKIDLSQYSLAPDKPVEFVVENDGTLPHQLVIQPYADPGGPKLGNAPVVAAGTSRTIRYTLPAGIYRIACAQFDHAEQGMVNAITVDSAAQPNVSLRMDLIIPIGLLLLGCAFIIGDSLGLRLTRPTQQE